MGRQSHRYREEFTTEFTPPADVYETGTSLVAVFELPGMSPENLSVSIEGSSLVVAGHRAENRGDRNPSLLQLEIVYGRFERRIPLPPGVDSGAEVSAVYREGVLRVEIPKGPGAGRDG